VRYCDHSEYCYLHDTVVCANLVLASKRLHKGSNILTVRNLVIDEEKMRPVGGTKPNLDISSFSHC